MALVAQINMINTDVLAYTAGFFDGEGCISIAKNGAVDIRITNTAKNVLVYIQSNFGGNITNRTQKVNKTQYTYSLYGEEGINFINLLLPYLKDKKDQALTIVEYYELRKEIPVIHQKGKRGRATNPDRELLVQVFRDILSEQKVEEH